MNIKLVKSKPNDSKFLYTLRNSSEIRAISINKKITFKKHATWFALQRNNKKFNYLHLLKIIQKKLDI